MTGPYDDARVDFESLSVLIPKTKQGDDRAREELFFQIQTYMQLMAAKALPAVNRQLGFEAEEISQ